MRKLLILALVLGSAGWLAAADSVEGHLSTVPIRLTGASCSGPGGTATLTMASNPFVAGQWIAVRDVPSSAPIVVKDEKVGTGDGSTTTFTFRTANYPIVRGTVTVMVGRELQGDDAHGGGYPGAGQFKGPGVGIFSGTVTISGGKTITLTSTPAVFDSRWESFMPTMAGQRNKYLIGSGVDSTHLKLMAPAPDGVGQSFTLPSEVDYFSGVAEITFTSAPPAGAPIALSYTAEHSQWLGEHKVASAGARTVSYAEPGCTGAIAAAPGGQVYPIPIIYVAPASHKQCTYDGDGGQACAPSDSNPGTSKAHPKATLDGVRPVVDRRDLTVPYLIQLADANGTGLGGSTAATDCYQPQDLTFSAGTMGGGPIDLNEFLFPDRFPQSYLWFRGNPRDPGKVLFNGSGKCSSSSRNIVTPEALRIDHMAGRVEGFSVQGYGNHIRPGMGPSAITFVNFATGFVEDMICTGSHDLNPGFFSLCIGAWDHSTVKTGGNHTVRNANWVHAINESNLFTTDPVNGPKHNTNLDYSSDTGGFAMGCSIMSNCQLDHITAIFTGSGSYAAQMTTEKSIFYFAERYVGSMCPNAACMDITINAPNMTWEQSGLGGHIDSGCTDSQESVCTLIAGPKIRAIAQEDSFIKDYGQSVIKGPDVATAGGCVEVWNAGWDANPGSRPPVCSAIEFKSESKSYVPLTLQSAAGSNVALMDLKTSDGDVATSFNAAGQISKMNGVPTAGNGIGVEVYSTIPAASNASIPLTTMLAPSTDGNFMSRFYITQVDSGSGCTAPAMVAVKLVYSDPFSGGPQPLTMLIPLNIGGNASGAPALSLSTGTISSANVATGTVVFRAKGSTAIQYSTTYTNGACTTQPQYRLVPVLEWF